MEWQDQLWQEIGPHLPAGRVGLWVAPACRPTAQFHAVHTLPEFHNPSLPKPPSGAAYQGLLLLGVGQAVLPWPALLAQLHPLLAPQAPLLLLTPRHGLVQLPKAVWHSPYRHRGWQRILRAAGWQITEDILLGGCSWPGPWVTAACRLYVCQRKGVIPPTRLQFNSKRAGTAAATGC
jgi:hypothetical protein